MIMISILTIVFILTMCDSSFINDEFLLLILSIVKSIFPFQWIALLKRNGNDIGVNIEYQEYLQ